MTSDFNDKKRSNVIDLASQRHRKKTTGGFKPRKRQGASSGKPAAKSSIWHVIQVMAFLALMAYFMQTCGG
tara:strand:- start:118 stop:330 length:213 start_codon:yes stop_codon:yes gene_type:complete